MRLWRDWFFWVFFPTLCLPQLVSNFLQTPVPDYCISASSIALLLGFALMASSCMISWFAASTAIVTTGRAWTCVPLWFVHFLQWDIPVCCCVFQIICSVLPWLHELSHKWILSYIESGAPNLAYWGLISFGGLPCPLKWPQPPLPAHPAMGAPHPAAACWLIWTLAAYSAMLPAQLLLVNVDKMLIFLTLRKKLWIPRFTNKSDLFAWLLFFNFLWVPHSLFTVFSPNYSCM